MEGKIVANNAGIYTIYSSGVNYNVFPKGSLKFKNKHLNVGDDVIFDDETLVIIDVKDKKNELIRPRCSNVDQLIIVMSVVEPNLSEELIYKFLTYANMNAVPSVVVLTKIDMLTDLTKVNELKSDLEKLDIKVFLTSNKDENSISEIKKVLDNKVNIIMGQTGVGKSSLINEIDPSYSRHIGEYSTALGRGKHKTKEVILLPYLNGFIGDTPGFSSLELDIFKEDIAHYFPGYNDLYLNCYFSDCLHQNEKECAVKKEIEAGKLSKSAYQIYLKLLNELPYRKERYSK